MSVPLKIIQGDTTTWEEVLSEYPGPMWKLTYTFVDATGQITVLATSTSEIHNVSLQPTTTATYIPGEYTWVSKVGDGTDVFTIATGRTNVIIDPSNLSFYDARSWARTALNNVEAVLGNRATLDQESYSIQGRSLARTPLTDLLNLRKYLQAEVASEDDLLNPGGPSTKKAVVRF